MSNVRRLLGADHYQAADSSAVYERLRELAEWSLTAGYPTIVDAACLQRAQRDPWPALAARLRVPYVLLHCDAPADVLRQRVRERALRGGDPSQADESVLQMLTATQQPLADDELARVLRVETDQAVSAPRWPLIGWPPGLRHDGSSTPAEDRTVRERSQSRSPVSTALDRRDRRVRPRAQHRRAGDAQPAGCGLHRARCGR